MKQKAIIRFVVMSILALPLCDYPAHAQQVPPHINAWTGSLYKTLEPTLEKFKENKEQTPHHTMVNDFYQEMRAARLTTWKGGEFSPSDKVSQAISTFLGQEINTQEMADFINYVAQKGSIPALRNHYAQTEQDITGEDLHNKAAELEDVLRNAWSETAQSYEVKSPDGQNIQIEWDPLIQIFEMSGEHDNGGQTKITNEIIAHADKNDKLSFMAKPLVDAIQPLTKEELQSKKHATEKQIIGSWTSLGGEKWMITVAGKNANKKDSAEDKLRNKIAQLKKDIATLKKQKSYVWKDKNGKEITQDKFKRLGDSYEYVGEKPSKERQEKISEMEAEYETLSQESGAQPLRVHEHDPNGYDELLESASGPLSITVTQNDGYSYTYDEAIFEGGVIRARRTLRDPRDITQLPDGIISQLVNSWAPPEWIELRFKQNPRNGDIYFEGERWRMHVTYSGISMMVKSIHSPYVNENLRMVVEGEREPQVELEFVDSWGRSYEEELPFGKTVYLKATFDEAPDEATRNVRLSWENDGQEADWIEVKRKVLKRKEYISEPFVLEDNGVPLNNNDGPLSTGGKLKL